jgi:hypothetical protein
VTGSEDGPVIDGPVSPCGHSAGHRLESNFSNQPDQNGNKIMMHNLMHEDLARAQMAARLGEAQQLRRGRQQAAAMRLSRRAEQAARQARLALARAI